MNDIRTGKWCPDNKLVTGRPVINGTAYPGFTGEVCPDKFGGDASERLYQILTPKTSNLKFNTSTPTLIPSKLPAVRKFVEKLGTGGAFERMYSTINT